MKAVNNEYDYLFPLLKDKHTNASGETYSKATTETADAWKDIINALIALHMQNVLCEIIGSFVWLSGDTRSYKEELKALGFRFSSNKLSWYLAPRDYKKQSRKSYNMDDLRDMFGSKTVDTSHKEQGKKTLTA
jgi:hypothetical protein